MYNVHPFCVWFDRKYGWYCFASIMATCTESECSLMTNCTHSQFSSVHNFCVSNTTSASSAALYWSDKELWPQHSDLNRDNTICRTRNRTITTNLRRSR